MGIKRTSTAAKSKPATETPAPETTQPTPAPKPPKEPHYTRAAAFADALRVGGTCAELTASTIQLCAAKNPTKTQPKAASVEWTVRDFCAPLLILGFVAADADGKLTLVEK